MNFSSRRKFIASTIALGGSAWSCRLNALSLTHNQSVDCKPGRAVLVDGSELSDRIQLRIHHEGKFRIAKLVNTGNITVRVKEVVLCSFHHNFPPDTGLYGEGFTMLTLTGGTLGSPRPFSGYSDTRHYKLKEPQDTKAYYGLVMLSPPGESRILMAFSSCRRFSGKFYVRDGVVDAVVDTEGLSLGPGEEWVIEELLFDSGASREDLLATLASRISSNHPQKLPKHPPAGWCSWYMQSSATDIVGTNVTASEVVSNLNFIKLHLPSLRYIQIDDGYQTFDGDWLDTGLAFGGDVQGVLRTIRREGFEPAIWVAPFVAEEKSRVLREHPDWFIQGENGSPLRSDKVTYGGWHRPWYVLDGTNPEAQEHLKHVFQIMRQDWGCTYFKLDANFWGAMPGGQHYDRSKTSVEAYRMGMDAIWEGAGRDSYILGCNHPLWPSFGLITGSRSSNDIDRSWPRFSETARETLTRNWQNGSLWWNDPDCVLVTGDLPETEYRFHATAILASGGAVLSGDNFPDVSAERLKMLRKLLPPTGLAARFENEDLCVGRIELHNETIICIFNWDNVPQIVSFNVGRAGVVTDFWDGLNLGSRQKGLMTLSLPARSVRCLSLQYTS